MVNKNIPEGTIKLDQTVGYSYMCFEPPLTDAEINELPYPKLFGVERRNVFRSCELAEDGSMEVGFQTDLFAIDEYPGDIAESFPQYASRVAQHLGHYMLDPKIHTIA